MRVCATLGEMRAARAEFSGTVGLVPTMGALHEGHLALVRSARSESDHVVVSIFVNPTQFASAEAADRYPRSLKRDLTLLEREGVDSTFVPTAEDLYPDGFASAIDVGPLANVLEGASRPGHFRGVATVVAKLLNIVQPSRTYFGQKDAQQLLVIRRMVTDLNLPVEIIGVPTVREPDGLAMSSRNALLLPEERPTARCLFRALEAAGERWEAGERDAETLREAMRAVIEAEPLANLDYASIADPTTLVECQGQVTGVALASLAVTIGQVRLIDNVLLGAGDPGTLP
jgi:pantoate--beta-alanine ligase